MSMMTKRFQLKTAANEFNDTISYDVNDTLPCIDIGVFIEWNNKIIY